MNLKSTARGDYLTCLWIEDLRWEVWWRRAGREVFIAVGDEGRQRVDVVGMLYHGNFIGLKQETQRQKSKQQTPHQAKASTQGMLKFWKKKFLPIISMAWKAFKEMPGKTQEVSLTAWST